MIAILGTSRGVNGSSSARRAFVATDDRPDPGRPQEIVPARAIEYLPLLAERQPRLHGLCAGHHRREGVKPGEFLLGALQRLLLFTDILT